MKYFITVLFVLFMSFFYYSHLCSTKTLTESILLTAKEDSFVAATSPPTLELKGKYVCLMDSDSKRILYGKNETNMVSMASTTKIMTCLLALEKGKKDDNVKVSKKAASMPKVRLGMRSGESFLLSDLLYSLMLTSHNDTAVALAEHIGGSVEGFATLMNHKAKKIGMKDTNFVTPNGLDANGHKSTASNMCLLGSYAIKNNEFYSIVQTKSHSFRSTSSKRSFIINNKDAFLSLYDGALGIKTGFTNKAGYCFVGAAKQNDMTLVSTTLASGWPPNKSYKWQDTKKLMDFGFAYYSKKSLPTKDLSYLRIPVDNGLKKTVSIENIDAPIMLLSDFDNIHVSYQIPDIIPAPVSKTVSIGRITYYINEQKIVSLPIYPTENIKKENYFDLLSSVIEKFFFSFIMKNDNL